MMRLQLLQNQRMRVIIGVDRYTSIYEMLNELQWPNISKKTNFNTLMLIFKMKMGSLPDYFSFNLITVAQSHSHETRGRNISRLPNYSATQNDIIGAIFVSWHTQPNVEKNNTSLNWMKTVTFSFITKERKIFLLHPF